MDTGTFRGIIAFLVLVSFLGITWWAYSRRRKTDFEEAANLPFAEDDELLPHNNRAQKGEPDTRPTDSRQDKGDRNT
ncbi:MULTISPECIES: cbb3-type cytochrome c oxidase subunit 3 [Halomonadaceae]|uniref:cbb3-type cytochrome oxidase subunit 3 n=1 Tax=Halomonadaceae TaxID=28256 RepID=UPI0015987DDF|nr:MULTISPECIES: cbb3-type cytochrome c oxidase subunit 3 [Halomonas]QJQ96801.1 cbb3-type cytochrome c oxidase subunit 3 [Halomonas sp. PA5]